MTLLTISDKNAEAGLYRRTLSFAIGFRGVPKEFGAEIIPFEPEVGHAAVGKSSYYELHVSFPLQSLKTWLCPKDLPAF